MDIKLKILDRYIIKSYFSRLIGVFAICFIIFIIQTFWLYVDELAGKGLDIFTIGKFFVYFSPKLVPLVLPLSILLASLMTYGTLSENSEFIAMKSNGISIIRTMVALLVFHVFLGVGAFYFSNHVVTYGELKSYNLRKNLAKLKPTLAIREGIFNDIGDMNIKVNRKYGDNEQYLEDIILHKINLDDEINRIVIKAESGEITSNNEAKKSPSKRWAKQQERVRTLTVPYKLRTAVYFGSKISKYLLFALYSPFKTRGVIVFILYSYNTFVLSRNKYVWII